MAAPDGGQERLINSVMIDNMTGRLNQAMREVNDIDMTDAWDDLFTKLGAKGILALITKAAQENA